MLKIILNLILNGRIDNAGSLEFFWLDSHSFQCLGQIVSALVFSFQAAMISCPSRALFFLGIAALVPEQNLDDCGARTQTDYYQFDIMQCGGHFSFDGPTSKRDLNV